MILNYSDIGHEKLEVLEKKNLKFKIFKPKEFDNYKKEQEEKNQIVSVVRNTKLKELKDDSDEVKNGEYLQIGDKKFKLEKERGRAATGYIPIDENRFVRIENTLLLFILLFGAIGILTFVLLTQIPIGEEPIIPLPDIEMDGGADDWDGEGNKGPNSVAGEQESTTIPGFSTFKATSTANLIKLYNYPENTVNFVYTITKPLSNEPFQEFELENKKGEDNIDEVQKFVNKNQLVYTNYYDEATKNYQVKDKDGNITDIMVEYKIKKTDDKYIVYKIESEVIYFTKGIAPNQSIDWNVYEALGVGVHQLQFRISPYDIETNALTYGAIQDVKITVVE